MTIKKSCISALFIIALTGCAANGTTPVKATIYVDAAITDRTMRHWDQGKEPRYRDLEELIDFFGKLPPPLPYLVAKPRMPGTPGTPGVPIDPYAPLLAFLRAGPGGSVITRAQLVQLTPFLTPLAPLAATMTLSQLLATPQAFVAFSALQAILPSSVFNQQTLTYILQNQTTLFSLLSTLNGNLISPPPGTPGTPGIPGIPTTFEVRHIDPLVVLLEMLAILKRNDPLEIGEKFRSLAYVIIGPSGFTKPLPLLYGSRTGRYRPSVSTEIDVGGTRHAHVLNEEGYLVNRNAFGAHRYYQGADDVSLTYIPFELKDRKVKTLDVIASDRFALLKRMSGGDVELLDRTSTHSTAMIGIDLSKNSTHVRLVGGTTPTSTMGGLMGEYKIELDLFSARIGLGAVVEDVYFSRSENFLGFLDFETQLRTPSYDVINRKDGNWFSLWGSVTTSTSGMAHRALSNKPARGRHVNRTWGYQGDIRVIPEVNVMLLTTYTTLVVSGGITTAVVPRGRVDLNRPANTLELYPIRGHFGGNFRINLSKIANNQIRDLNRRESEKEIKEWWSEEEKQAYRDSLDLVVAGTDDTVFLAFSGVVEISALRIGARASIGIEFFDTTISFVGEMEHYRVLEFDNTLLGFSAEHEGFYLRALRSLDYHDGRIEIGFRFGLN